MKRVLLASLAFISTVTTSGMEQPPSPTTEVEFPKELNCHLVPILYHGILKTVQSNPLLRKRINNSEEMLDILKWTAKNARYLAHAVDLAERLQKHSIELPVMQDPRVTNWLSKTEHQLEDGQKFRDAFYIVEGRRHLANHLKKRFLDINYIPSTTKGTMLRETMYYSDDYAGAAARILLAAGASTEKTGIGCTPLSLAIYNKNCPFIKLLLESGALPETNDFALLTDNSAIADLLHQARAKYESTALKGKFSSLPASTTSGEYLQKFELFFKLHGIITTAAIDLSFQKIINRPTTMLSMLQWFSACAYQTSDALYVCEKLEEQKELLPVMKDEQIICWKKKTVEKLKNGQELINAVAANDANRVKSLLKHKHTHINYEGKLGYTPLMESIARVHTTITQKLISEGANVHAQDIAGNTALHLASTQGDLATVRLLLDAGADIDSQNEDGRTPLMESVANNHAEASKLLIDAGAKTSSKDKSGNTPSRITHAKGNHTATTARLVIPGSEEVEKELRDFVEKERARK